MINRKNTYFPYTHQLLLRFASQNLVVDLLDWLPDSESPLFELFWYLVIVILGAIVISIGMVILGIFISIFESIWLFFTQLFTPDESDQRIDENLETIERKKTLDEASLSDLIEMNVVELKQHLRDEGLPVSGRKSVLIERLQNSRPEKKMFDVLDQLAEEESDSENEPTRNSERITQRTGFEKAGVPKILIDGFETDKCSEEELLEIWHSFDCVENWKGRGNDKTICHAMIEICADRTRLPNDYKDFSMKEILAVMQDLTKVNKGMIDVVFAPENDQISKDDIEFLLDIGERHPTLLSAVLDDNDSRWNIDTSKQLLELPFNDHPEAVIEVVNGANVNAIATKRGWVQL
tara:strand:+ start:368 stop:1417 length:1050 start_codon:yes stop_codon:yes gene_type:complete